MWINNDGDTIKGDNVFSGPISEIPQRRMEFLVRIVYRAGGHADVAGSPAAFSRQAIEGRTRTRRIDFDNLQSRSVWNLGPHVQVRMALRILLGDSDACLLSTHFVSKKSNRKSRHEFITQRSGTLQGEDYMLGWSEESIAK